MTGNELKFDGLLREFAHQINDPFALFADLSTVNFRCKEISIWVLQHSYKYSYYKTW